MSTNSGTMIKSPVPNTIHTVPGAWNAYNNLLALDVAAQNLDDSFKTYINYLNTTGQKVVFYQDIDEVTDALDTLNLQAGARFIEFVTCTRAYIHLMDMNGKYRIGPLVDEADWAEVRGCMVMGRSPDDLTNDPNGTYLRENGVPAEFATFNGTPSASDRASYPVAPYVNKKGKVVTKTSKPRNPWIIYRALRHAIVQAENPNLHTSQLSSIIKQEWRMMDLEVKALYQEMALKEKLVHEQTYPDFELKPRKSEDIKRRRTGPSTAVPTLEMWNESR